MNDLPYILKFIDDFCVLLRLNRNELDHSTTFVSQEIASIQNLIKNQEIDQVNSELFKFRALYKDLDFLNKSNSLFAKKYIKSIRTCPRDNYYGIRFEIQISAKLESNRLNYSRPKSRPDFLVEFENSCIKIECTSRHLNVSKRAEDVMKGFTTAIDQKKDYDFVDENTALFIDASNLSFNDPRLFSNNHIDTINFLSQKLVQTNFGNITTFDWVWNIDNNRYVSIYNRIDSAKISKTLEKFMDHLWPGGPFRLEKFASPIVG